MNMLLKINKQHSNLKECILQIKNIEVLKILFNLNHNNFNKSKLINENSIEKIPQISVKYILAVIHHVDLIDDEQIMIAYKQFKV